MTADDFWANRFHACALLAGFIAHGEGRLHEREYVRRLAYDLYEGGAFRGRGPGHAAVDSDPGVR